MEDTNKPTEEATPEVKEVPALSVPFSAAHNKTAGSITFVHVTGRSFTILSTNKNFDRAMELISDIDKSDPGSDLEDGLRSELHSLTVPVSRITNLELGDIRIDKGNIFYKEQQVHNVVGERILSMLDHDEDPKTMLRFLNNLMENPSFNSVQETFRFLDANKMAITRDGMILAYKKVNSEFKSIRAGVDGIHLDNTPGVEVIMPRNEVNDNSAQTCSTGLHLAAASYLPSYGSGYAGDSQDRVVICVCNPRDVVSIPNDYNNAKMRVCRYTVLRELAADEGDPLASGPVWNPTIAA